MEKVTLADREVEKAVAQFIAEARICAQTDCMEGICGLAAMSMILSCVAAVGEALHGKRETRMAFEAFFDEMPDKESWLRPPDGADFNEGVVCSKVVEARHKLAHSLSMPRDVRLVKDKESVATEPTWRWQIIVPDFIDAVEETVGVVREKHPNKIWDPEKKDLEDMGLVEVQVTYNTVAAELLGRTYGESSLATGVAGSDHKSGEG